jgi:hypothetical protein
MRNPQGHGGEKAFLIIVSLSIGLVIGVQVAVDFRGGNPVLREGRLMAGIFWTALIALVYTVTAGFVSLCEGMKWIAYRGQSQRWGDGVRIVLGALWPLTFVCCLITYTFLAVIHRLF